MCPPRRTLLESLGSGVTSLRELSWETAGIEQQVRETFSSFGTRVTNLVGPASHPVKEFAKERPITAICVGAFVAACSLPILGFLTFALITLGIGLISFLCIEGTILSFALLILGSCLLTITFVGLSIGAGLLFVYLGIVKTQQLLRYIASQILPKSKQNSSDVEIKVMASNGKAPKEEELSGTESEEALEQSSKKSE